MNHDFKSELIKKYKLTGEQEKTYSWLKQQNLNTDDRTLCYWTKLYSSKRIQEVVNFAKSRRNAGQDIRNIGGWIQQFLKKGHQVVDENCMINRTYLKKFIEETKWKELNIYEKYIKDTVTGDDIPLNLEADSFMRSLKALYQKSQLYK